MEFLPSEAAVRMLAARAGLSESQARAFCQAQAELAHELADKGFPLPGLGAFGRSETPGREMVMPFGPDKGKVKKIPPARRIRFYRCGAFKDAMKADAPAVPADVFAEEMEFDEGEFE